VIIILTMVKLFFIYFASRAVHGLFESGGIPVFWRI
jgi:hypothetical protein